MPESNVEAQGSFHADCTTHRTYHLCVSEAQLIYDKEMVGPVENVVILATIE